MFPRNLPGGAGGRLRGRHVLDFTGKLGRQPCCLFMSMIHQVEVRPKAFGDAQQVIPEL
jgi:hypothetical protein